jgi:hypothetical protein
VLPVLTSQSQFLDEVLREDEWPRKFLVLEEVRGNAKQLLERVVVFLEAFAAELKLVVEVMPQVLNQKTMERWNGGNRHGKQKQAW